MCTIAGYTGNKRAVPELIAMMRKEQFFDSGICTGIATIDKGKLYTAKVFGDLDTLLKKTDAANFPGTIGIIHSRPHGEAKEKFAHPFLDANHRMAAVYNGTANSCATAEYIEKRNSLMQSYFERGFPISSLADTDSIWHLDNGKAYHFSELTSLLCGEMIDKGMDIRKALRLSLDMLPSDIIAVMLHLNEPQNIIIGRISRPMSALIGEKETYISTSAIAFPENIGNKKITSIPLTSICTIKPGSIEISSEKFENIRIEEITPEIHEKAYSLLENRLSDKNAPEPFDERPFFKEWKYLWSEPYNDCKYALEKMMLKPCAALIYDILYDFYKEGRLHQTLGEARGMKRTLFWVNKK